MNKMPVGILLAAGKSQRFGSNKLLHPINNIPMLFLSAQKLASVLPGSLVVINPQLKNITAQLEQLGLQVVINEKAEQGMGSSIACGVSARPDAAGWLITLADMPYVKTGTLSLLANKLMEGVDIIAPVCKEQRGHPVGFNHRYKNELMQLKQDVGARDIIKKHQQQLELLETNDKGVIQDIDCPDDIEILGRV
ncbi:MAG: nucleotidyltransferase family protein [Gammaproteobacteria bacterium]|nr:nucleotidyltransferase family protein [Gammaproteobacteria bacterium]MCW8988660.1 nucleotidyltransferase family protein [Gammaproteobacteria bacterium]MCW9031890.1 nucleotidyltransferase family protein [Gammaproteobacteria bacterium]